MLCQHSLSVMPSLCHIDHSSQCQWVYRKQAALSRMSPSANEVRHRPGAHKPVGLVNELAASPSLWPGIADCINLLYIERMIHIDIFGLSC